MQCSEAYQTLADPDKRAVYDRENSLRRMNFFRDVDVSDLALRCHPSLRNLGLFAVSVLALVYLQDAGRSTISL